jgi:hypothetical protein
MFDFDPQWWWGPGTVHRTAANRERIEAGQQLESKSRYIHDEKVVKCTRQMAQIFEPRDCFECRRHELIR